MSTRVPASVHRLGWAMACFVVLTAACTQTGQAATCDPKVIEALHPDSGVHVIPGAPLNWDTDTPTSGPHFSLAPQRGALNRTLEPAAQVTALEAGLVIIHYRADLASDQIDEIVAFAGSDVVTVPSNDSETVIMLTAWQTRMNCTALDAAEVRAFIRDHAGRAPAHS